MSEFSFSAPENSLAQPAAPEMPRENLNNTETINLPTISEHHNPPVSSQDFHQAAPLTAAPVAVAPIAPPHNPRRKFCPVCSASLAHNTKYCPCGHVFVSASFARSAGISLQSANIKRQKSDTVEETTNKPAQDRNEDVCAVCGDRGRLLCCDQCELAFHIDCAGLSQVPKGFWLCPRCESNNQNGPDKKQSAAPLALTRELSVFDIAQQKLFESLDPEQGIQEEFEGFLFTAYPPPGVKIPKTEEEKLKEKEKREQLQQQEEKESREKQESTAAAVTSSSSGDHPMEEIVSTAS